MKRYTIYWSDEPYYGIGASWETYYDCDRHYGEVVIDRKFLINEAKELIKYNDEYQQNYLPMSEFMDFIDTLSNNLNGDELYDNLCKNLEFVESITNKACRKNEEFRAKYRSIVYPEAAHYSEGCSLRLFKENVNFLLRNPDEFIKWFMYELKKKSEFVFSMLFNEKTNLEQTLKYYDELIKQNKNRISYHEKEIKEIVKQNEKLLKEQLEVVKQLNKIGLDEVDKNEEK